MLERKIILALSGFIKRDIKGTFNFTKTIILRAPFLPLFYRQPKTFCIKFQIKFLSSWCFSFLKKKRWKIYLLLKACFAQELWEILGKSRAARSLRNKAVQTLRSYHDFATSTIAIRSGGKNEASESTGLIDKSLTRIDLIAWWHSRPREPGRLYTGVFRRSRFRCTRQQCSPVRNSRFSFLFYFSSSFYCCFSFVHQRLASYYD